MLDCWHSAVFRDIITKLYELTILFVEGRINGENFLIGKKTRIWFLCFFWAFNKWVLFCRLLWTIAALNRGFLDRLRLFPLIFFIIVDKVETAIFFFSVSFVIFGHGSSSNAFLTISWLITWGLFDRVKFLGTLRPSNVVTHDEQSLCWRSAALKSGSPRVTKWIYQFF